MVKADDLERCLIPPFRAKTYPEIFGRPTPPFSFKTEGDEEEEDKDVEEEEEEVVSKVVEEEKAVVEEAKEEEKEMTAEEEDMWLKEKELGRLKWEYHRRIGPNRKGCFYDRHWIKAEWMEKMIQDREMDLEMTRKELREGKSRKGEEEEEEEGKVIETEGGGKEGEVERKEGVGKEEGVGKGEGEEEGTRKEEKVEDEKPTEAEREKGREVEGEEERREGEEGSKEDIKVKAKGEDSSVSFSDRCPQTIENDKGRKEE